jgi:hypothetical protein
MNKGGAVGSIASGTGSRTHSGTARKTTEPRVETIIGSNGSVREQLDDDTKDALRRLYNFRQSQMGNPLGNEIAATAAEGE